MKVGRNIAAVALCGISLFGVSNAQLIATKDLTVLVPPKKSEQPSESKRVGSTESQSDANCVVGIRDGVLVAEKPEKLALQIVDVVPRQLHEHASVLVTVRLTNEGDDSVSVP